LHDTRCAATIPTDCESKWVPHTAGHFTNSAWRHSGASSLTECQRACEFDPHCIAADWVGRRCWITTNPDHGHWSAAHRSELSNYIGHYYLRRCIITTGQCFQHNPDDFQNIDTSPISNLYPKLLTGKQTIRQTDECREKHNLIGTLLV